MDTEKEKLRAIYLSPPPYDMLWLYGTVATVQNPDHGQKPESAVPSWTHVWI